ncbi:hypothetical protein MVEN_00216300 [Mycena venus]|uniref:Uncharacterized protein n=1 Tax=Mycena venus TaxID=2733690 RepID=A0A8H7DB21_9AGAR|nr:hypothetical protein MVEN_00216300 [Mycena venus]
MQILEKGKTVLIHNVNPVRLALVAEHDRTIAPLDLVQFSHLNRECRDIVTSANLFQRSVAKLGGPILNPTFLTPNAITFLFTESECWACGKRTNAYPLSFSLRIRVCNDLCKVDLYRKSTACGDKFATIPSRTDRKSEDIHLEHIEPWAPFLETSSKGMRVYSRRQLSSARTRLTSALEADQAEGFPPARDNSRNLLLEVNQPVTFEH